MSVFYYFHIYTGIYVSVFVCVQVLCWRDVPTDRSQLGDVARGSEPLMRQVFVVAPDDCDDATFTRKVM